MNTANFAHARSRFPRALRILFAAYAVASLIHFVHNAAFLADYPHLPQNWTATGVMLAWVAISAVGGLAAFLLARDHKKTGLCVTMVYAACGLDSLGHYVLASPSLHTQAMNATIMLEVSCAALLFGAALRELTRAMFSRENIE